jgi:hypothetical protein
MTARVTANAARLAVAAFVAMAGGCRPPPPATVPAEARTARAGSAVMAEADDLIAALSTADLARIQAWMTPQLRSEVPLSRLEVASRRLADTFGAPVGILEEHVHREADLRWYSGLVLHEKPGDPPVQAPVLYQFALAPDGRLARLLVREHWFADHVEHPAVDYLPITRLHAPFEGEWTVSQGGPTRATNKHHGSRAQRWAYDIVVKKDGRNRPPGSSKTKNQAYYCYGKWLVAPAAGTVVRIENGVKENVPGKRGTAGGNGLVIDHGFGEFSSMWHMIPGSVQVKVGDRVEAGQRVGRAGNSGRSTGPHLHYHLSQDEPKRKKGSLPAPFVDVWVEDRWQDRAMPVRGDRVRSGLTPGRSSKRRASGPQRLIDA